jgi:hypothetical protein
MSDYQKAKKHVKTSSKFLRYLKKARSRAVRRAGFGEEYLALRSTKAGWEIS